MKFSNKYVWSRIALLFGILSFGVAIRESANCPDSGFHYFMQAFGLFFGSIAFISRKKQKFGGSNAWLLLEIPSVLIVSYLLLHISCQQIQSYPISYFPFVGSIIAWILILTGRKSSIDEIQKT
jgi:hypothetical protein